MIRTIAYAIVDQRGNPASVYLEHERAVSAVASRRGVIVHDLVLREVATELQKLLEEARGALAGGLWDYGPGQDEHTQCQLLINRIDAELKVTL